MLDTPYWHSLDTLVTANELVIDRPRGSTHPRYPNLYYPLDYGYVKDTRSEDGDGIDVWIGSLAEKLVTGIVCTIDLLKRDSEIKILLGCTSDEMQQISSFHQSGMQTAMLVER